MKIFSKFFAFFVLLFSALEIQGAEQYDTINVEIALCKSKYYSGTPGDWYFEMYDGEANGWYFDIFAPETGLEDGKTYSSNNDDMDLWYTYYEPKDDFNDYADSAWFTKTVTERGYTISAGMLTRSGSVYQLAYVYDSTRVSETVDIEASGLRLFHRDWVNYSVFKVHNDTMDINLSLYTDHELGAGTYTAGDYLDCDYSYLILPGQDRMYIIDGSITVTDNAGTVTLTGWVRGTDWVKYNLNLTGKTGGLMMDETERQFNVTFAHNDMDVSKDGKKCSIYVLDKDFRCMELTLFADKDSTRIPAGTYPISNTREIGTALKSDGYVDDEYTCCFVGESTLDYICNYDAIWFLESGSVTIVYDEYGKMNVYVTGLNSYGCSVSANVVYTKLEPKSTENITADNLGISDAYYDALGIFAYSAWNSEYSLYVYAFSDTPAGIFTQDDLYMDEFYKADGTDIDIIECELIATKEGKNLGLTGWILGSDTVKYILDISGYEGSLEYDTNSDFSASFQLDSILVDSESNLRSVFVMNEKGQGIDMFLFADGAGKSIPAGTYLINDTNDPFTVNASVGFKYGMIFPSYVYWVEDGNVSYWFMTDGTVTVDRNGNIEVNATNSYGKSVHVTISRTPTGLDNVSGSENGVRKVFENGRFIIYTENGTFNLGGGTEE